MKKSSNKFAFAPAGSSKVTIQVLKRCIEYIGSTQTGHGSDLAKGKRYLKNKTGCTTNSINYLFKSVKKLLNHDFETYGIYVFKYDKNKCCEILKSIICFVDEHSSEKIKQDLFSTIKIPCPYLSVLYYKQKMAIEWVEAHDYKGQRMCARQIINEIAEINNEICLVSIK